MHDSDETQLPGIGTRHDLTLESGTRMAVVIRRDSGMRDLFVYDPRDPDTCQAAVQLSEGDTKRLIELLGRDGREARG